jgi:hypothetical protein
MNPSGISRSTDVSSRLAQSLLAGLILVLDGLPAIGFEGESGTPKAPGQVEVGPVAPEENVRRQGDFENTLGMRFVPVKVGSETVHFSIWETRVRDYQAYANSATGVDASWRSATFKRKMVTPFDTCPVMNVSWNDAQKFAIWLTEKERREGRISASARYRLPTDTEWSWAVGIGDLRWPPIFPETITPDAAASETAEVDVPVVKQEEWATTARGAYELATAFARLEMRRRVRAKLGARSADRSVDQ